MRGLRNFIVLICELIIFALLVIFAVENIRSARYTFIGNTFTGNVWWTVAGSALLGFLFALLLLGPGTIAAGLRSRSLRREHDRIGQEFAALRDEHERLRAEHARTVRERDQLRSSLSSVSAANAANAANATRYSANDGTTRYDANEGVAQTSANVQNTVPQSAAGVNYDEASPQPEQGTGWRGRLHRLRTGGGTTADEMGTPNSPPAPTA